ncbi:MAG TPA: glycosyltransferase, partial [Candidatus Acidoferrum sp.]|nr:glycosyltransferase [Candidatus Acidoferrum sp.]
MTAAPGRLSVLIVCGSFHLGGSERNVVKIAAGLDPERFMVTVLVFRGEGPLREELEARGIPIIALDWSFDPRRLWRDFERLQHAIERVSPDILHLFNYPTIYFALAAGVMAEVPVRLVAIQALDTWKGWTEWITDRLTRSAVTLYLADGEGARQFVVRQQGLDPARVRLHYDGPDVEELVSSSPAAALKGHLGLEPDRPVVGLV